VGSACDQEEQALLARCHAGDEEAWAVVFRLHAPRIALYLRATLGQPDVDDLVQRVFLELVTSLPRFRKESSLSAWLHGIAHNLAHKEIRSTVRRRNHHTAYQHLQGTVEGFERSAGDRVEAREQLALVARALEELDLRFRSVWVMREVEGLSVEEVAAALGEQAATVRTRHHRAREKVLAALTELERERTGRVVEQDHSPRGVSWKGVRA